MMRRFYMTGLVLLPLTLALLMFSASYAYAICIPCVTPAACTNDDCNNAEEMMQDKNDEGLEDILQDNDHNETEDTGLSFRDQLDEYEKWLEYFAQEQVIKALRMMTTQFTNVAMHQVFIVGQFFDARIQMKTQSLLQTLQAQAHRDYHPSRDFCTFGTNVKSLAATERISGFHKEKVNAAQMARQLGKGGNTSAFIQDADKEARWDKFTQDYCDPQDNNWREAVADSGLAMACGGGAATPERVNIDIDYTRLVDFPRTLNLDFEDTEDFEDVIALASNLYGHEPLTRLVNSAYLSNDEYQELYMDLRSVAARRNVAENSFNAIVGLKAAGSSDLPDLPAGEAPQTANFLGAILSELNIPEDEIYEYIGERPSYYAQLEILTKKIYQNPNFYANLYDTPANVQRKSVALRALDLMLDRAIYESQLRREMATSVLLSTRLNEKQRAVSAQLLAGER